MRILIVDDEPLVRMGIKTLLSKNCNDSLIMHEAPNGVVAKDMLQEIRVDIVLTDIKMPRMDGIELTKWIKNHMPEVVVIILSNYNDFDFVRQAMKFGASDYMLKYAVDDDTVKKILNEYTRSRKSVADTEENGDNNALKQLVLKELILEGDVSLYKQCGKDIDWRLNSETKTFICLKIMHYNRILNDKYNGDKHALDVPLKSLLLEKLDKDFTAKLFLDTHGKYLAIIAHEKGEDISTKLKTVIYSVNKYMGIEMNIGYSSAFKNMEYVSMAKKEAENAIERCFFLSTSQNVLRGEHKANNAFPDAAYVKTVVDKCKTFFANNDIHGFSTYTEAFVKHITRNGNRAEPVLDMARQIVDQYKIARLKYVDSDNTLEFFNEIGSCLKDVENIDDLRNVFCMVVNRKAYFIKNMMKPGSYDIITNKAIEYINNNYCSSALNLVATAEKINVNPTYLSRVFKEKTGKSFITYVTELRIEQSIELLKSKEKLIKEVCFEVGYENYNHFCKTFKKHTGKSPSDYR